MNFYNGQLESAARGQSYETANHVGSSQPGLCGSTFAFGHHTVPSAVESLQPDVHRYEEALQKLTADQNTSRRAKRIFFNKTLKDMKKFYHAAVKRCFCFDLESLDLGCTFPKVNDFIVHWKSNHGLRSFYSCIKCDKEFVVLDHSEKLHAGLELDSGPAFCCLFCLEDFDKLIDIKLHLVIHHFTEIGVGCSKCTFISETPSELHRHYVSTHGNKSVEKKLGNPNKVSKSEPTKKGQVIELELKEGQYQPIPNISESEVIIKPGKKKKKNKKKKAKKVRLKLKQFKIIEQALQGGPHNSQTSVDQSQLNSQPGSVKQSITKSRKARRKRARNVNMLEENRHPGSISEANTTIEPSVKKSKTNGWILQEPPILGEDPHRISPDQQNPSVLPNHVTEWKPKQRITFEPFEEAGETTKVPECFDQDPESGLPSTVEQLKPNQAESSNNCSNVEQQIESITHPEAGQFASGLPQGFVLNLPKPAGRAWSFKPQ